MFQIPVPILILQHPQEPSRKDGAVSSARIILENLSPSHLSVGLSWRNLGHALKGFEALKSLKDFESPSYWHTLYLGTKKNAAQSPSNLPGIYYLSRNGDPIEPPENPTLGGLILLDGTWAQAKTLWWRNPWLLKTQRIFIVPKSKSLYGAIRREPRPECVSTLEAAAETLQFLGLDETIERDLKKRFSDQLAAYRP